MKLDIVTLGILIGIGWLGLCLDLRFDHQGGGALFDWFVTA